MIREGLGWRRSSADHVKSSSRVGDISHPTEGQRRDQDWPRTLCRTLTDIRVGGEDDTSSHISVSGSRLCTFLWLDPTPPTPARPRQ